MKVPPPRGNASVRPGRDRGDGLVTVDPDPRRLLMAGEMVGPRGSGARMESEPGRKPPSASSGGSTDGTPHKDSGSDPSVSAPSGNGLGGAIRRRLGQRRPFDWIVGVAGIIGLALTVYQVVPKHAPPVHHGPRAYDMRVTVVGPPDETQWCPKPSDFSVRVASNSPLNGNWIQGNLIGAGDDTTTKCAAGYHGAETLSFVVRRLPFVPAYSITYEGDPTASPPLKSPMLTFGALQQAEWRVTF
jgi:hypothetical protein